MRLKDGLKRLVDKEYRELVKHVSTSTDIDLTSFKYVSWNKIKKYINRNVKSIKVNFTEEIGEDLEYFKKFSDLERIDFGRSVSLNEKHLLFFSGLGIKELTALDLFINYKNLSGDMVVVSSSSCTKMFYNGMIVNVSSHNSSLEGNQLIIEGQLDDTVISNLLSKMDLSNIEEIQVNLGFVDKVNSYVIKRHGKVIDSLEILSCDLTELEKVYNLLLYKGFSISEVSIRQRCYSLGDVFKLMYLYNGNAFNKARIKCSGIGDLNDLYIETNLEDGKFSAKIVTMDLSNAKELYSYLCKNEIDVNEFIICLDSIPDKYSESFDMEYLRNLSKKCDLKIEYNNGYVCSYEEWKGLYESVKWYRKLITSYELSPAEKVLYAHDLMKTIPYTHPGTSGVIGRAPHSVMSTEYVVCAGYTNLFSQIMSGMDSKIGVAYNHYDERKHASVIVRIDDDKYNIHGLFELDPTWDSEIVSDVKEQYNFDRETSLDLYQSFLMPILEHVRINGRNELPRNINVFLAMIGESKSNQEIDEVASYKMFSMIKELFGEVVSAEKMYSYLRVKRPSLADFKSMLLSVRKAQGFSHEEAVKEVDRIVKFNIDYANYINEVSNRPKEIKATFFEDKVRRGV